MAFMWFLHVQENVDYSAYCSAKNDGDATTCARLEGKFVQIACLYKGKDCGAIYFLDDGTEITSVELWGQWLHTHISSILQTRAAGENSRQPPTTTSRTWTFTD